MSRQTARRIENSFRWRHIARFRRSLQRQGLQLLLEFTTVIVNVTGVPALPLTYVAAYEVGQRRKGSDGFESVLLHTLNWSNLPSCLLSLSMEQLVNRHHIQLPLPRLPAPISAIASRRPIFL